MILRRLIIFAIALSTAQWSLADVAVALARLRSIRHISNPRPIVARFSSTSARIPPQHAASSGRCSLRRN